MPMLHARKRADRALSVELERMKRVELGMSPTENFLEDANFLLKCNYECLRKLNDAGYIIQDGANDFYLFAYDYGTCEGAAVGKVYATIKRFVTGKTTAAVISLREFAQLDPAARSKTLNETLRTTASPILIMLRSPNDPQGRPRTQELSKIALERANIIQDIVDHPNVKELMDHIFKVSMNQPDAELGKVVDDYLYDTMMEREKRTAAKPLSPKN